MAQLAINGGTPQHTGGWPQWPADDPGHIAALQGVLDSGVWGVGGPANKTLSESFKTVSGAAHNIPCTSGTTALEVALRALDIGCGHEVIVPPYTFVATASAVLAVNAIPVFADILPDTFCLDPAAVEAAITPHTRAVIAVHIGGMPPALDELKEVCQRHDLRLIEDCAQSHGAVYRGQLAGSIGDAGAFSFQSSKNLTAGEGGIISTNDWRTSSQAWSYVNVGRVPEGGWYDHRVMGMNLRLSEFQAALILQGMTRLEKEMQQRDRCADRLRELLGGIEGITPQVFTPGAERSAWHLFICRYDRAAFGGLSRDKFVDALTAEGIPASRGYNPLYREGLFTQGLDYTKCPFSCDQYKGQVDYQQVQCPVAEEVCLDGSFWLPHQILLSEPAEMEIIAAAIQKIRDHQSEIKES